MSTSSSGGGDVLSSEVKWRNYQHLIWSQQQIHMQIQQQQLQQIQNPQSSKLSLGGDELGAGDEAPPPNSSSANLEDIEKTVEKFMDEKVKDISDPWEHFDAQSAFLGPTLWDKRLPYDGHDFKLEYVDLEEFLTENGIPVDEGSASKKGGERDEEVEEEELKNEFLEFLPGPSSRRSRDGGESGSGREYGNSSSRSSSPSSSSLISQNSGATPTPSTHSAHLSPFQISVPGPDFDPRRRMFTTDELKPQPMIKKSKKQLVPDDAKDAKYWMRRRKNNMAAKRSRDARRVKENQIAMRACYLEKENSFMRQELERAQKENLFLKEQLNHFTTNSNLNSPPTPAPNNS